MPKKRTARVTRHCEHCAETFEAWPAEIRRGGARFCSKTCSGAFKTRPIGERFWRYVEITETCWPWTGSLDNGGYGQLATSKDAGPESAPRVSWLLHRGPIPEGRHVLHQCDVNYPPGDISYRRCVRPDHLFLGTNNDNIADMVAKGRQSRGSAMPHAKLTEAQVVEIRRRWADGHVMQKTLCAEYDVSPASMSLILNGKTWTHVSH